jgi:hypothetical protein
MFARPEVEQCGPLTLEYSGCLRKRTRLWVIKTVLASRRVAGCPSTFDDTHLYSAQAQRLPLIRRLEGRHATPFAEILGNVFRVSTLLACPFSKASIILLMKIC